MNRLTRRTWIKNAAASGLATSLLPRSVALAQQRVADLTDPSPGDRPFQDASAKVVNPRGKVPISFIIDDSTCLVNLAHFCIPHFAEVYPERYRQDWRSLPREIPDRFVTKFIDWCDDHGVKGKYSIVPYPACVGWVDRDMPGWPRRELLESIRLVRTRIMPNWDIHPEMVTHTFVIDTKTGRPFAERTEDFLENTGWSVGRSTDELANYIAYGLQILKNAGFVCEGITTPGGFGNRARRALAAATAEACRDIFRTPIPHYFRHLFTGSESVAPRVENAADLKTSDPKCVVSIIGCTGDWFGGWDALTPGSVDKFITVDLQSGRMIEVIERGEPAIMVCHWPGIYFNGKEIGFNIFQKVVQRLEERYTKLNWMKLSEIARYWAAKELTEIRRQGTTLSLDAPFATSDFTLTVQADTPVRRVSFSSPNGQKALNPNLGNTLASHSFTATENEVTIVFDLPKGPSQIVLS